VSERAAPYKVGTEAKPAPARTDVPVAEAERNLRDVFVCLSGNKRQAVEDGYYGRDIVVTPYEGEYGLAGYVVCLNGSPARGTFLVPKQALSPNSIGFGIIYVDSGSARSRVYLKETSSKVEKWVYEAVTVYLRARGKGPAC
jgi:hypothetical protein